MLMKHTIFYSMSDECFIPFFSFDKRLECTDLGRFCLKILAPIQSAVLTDALTTLLAHYNESGAFFLDLMRDLAHGAAQINPCIPVNNISCHVRANPLHSRYYPV